MSEPKSVSQTITKIKSESKIELDESIKRCLQRRFILPALSREDFNELLINRGTKYLHDKNEPKEFVLRTDHEFIYLQLYNWLIGNNSFQVKEGIPGNLFNGIILLGNIGCGKSLLLEAFLQVYSLLSRKVISKLYADSAGDILKKDKSAYDNGFLYFDDLGREAKKVKDYGNEIRPVIELIGRRYITGAYTFATVNYEPPYYENNYGSFTADRLFSMCNLISLPGGSARPKQANINLQLNFDVK
jgi:hypothetical protein